MSTRVEVTIPFPAAAEANSFDPVRHRVWEVEMEMRYTTYVIAADREEAEECASAHAHEDEPWAEWDSHVVEMEILPAGADEARVPWGPNLWNGKNLTVAEAIAWVQNPTCGPPQYDTQTLLMPFATEPPPLRCCAEEVRRG